MPDARELFNAPTPPPVTPPEPVAAPPEPVAPAPISQPIPVEAPVVPTPAQPEPQQDHWRKALQDTMEYLKVVDPSGSLADGAREFRREGPDYYRPRQSNGQFAPQQVPQQSQFDPPPQPRYVGEMLDNELADKIGEVVERRIGMAEQKATYRAILSAERQDCMDRLVALTQPRVDVDSGGNQRFIPAQATIQELEDAGREAATYGIDQSQPGGYRAHSRLTLMILDRNRSLRPNAGLQASPNPVAAQVATPAAGSPAMPQGKSAEQLAKEKVVERMMAAERPSARQLFSK